MAESDYETSDYERRAEVFQRGYEYDYQAALGTLGDPMPERESNEVHRILQMFCVIAMSTRDPADLSEDAVRMLTSDGFDGNEESAQYAYVQHYVETGRYSELRGGPLNSHMPMLGRYRRMLSVFDSFDRDLFHPELSDEQLAMLAYAPRIG